MSTPSQRFQTIIARLRPHRVAILINVNDPDWQRTCLRVIEYFSQIWGGAHSLVIPTDGNVIDACFWELLSAFDPDTIHRYQKTGYDLFVSKAPNFCEYLDRQVKDANDNGIPPEQIDRIREDILKSPLEGDFTISPELTAQIRLRLAPFDFADFYQINYISWGSKPTHPLTYVGDVFPALPVSPDHITDIKNDPPATIQMPPTLWLLSECGVASEGYQKALERDCNIQVVPKQLINTNEYELIAIGTQPGLYFNDNSPFALSRIGLKGVRSSAVRLDQLPSVLIVGDTVKDFCLAYGLSRLQGRAAWVPSWFNPDAGADSYRLRTLVGILHQRARRENSNHFAIMSASRPTAEMHPIVDSLRTRVAMLSATAEDANNGQYIRKLVTHSLVWYISGNVEQITNQMIVDDTLPGTFESPAPSIFAQINPLKHRWLVELTYWERTTPRHPALGRRMIFGSNVGDVRAGSHGATYMCPGVFVRGEDMEFQVLRPTVAFPDAEAIFRTALDFAGLECKVSDKGAYAQASVDKFGGLEHLARDLRIPSLFNLLQRYRNNKDRPKEGVFDEGVVLRDQRRYLNFACIQKIIGDIDSAKRAVDRYIGRGIFYRGFVFKCQRCADCSWFSIEELTQTFTCRRCGTRQQYVQASWNHPDEPSWFYKLDEIVYHMLAHDGHVSILALDKLRRNSIRDFQFAPELQIRSKDEKDWEMEIDICCISAGHLQIGEAKSVAALGSRGKSAMAVAARYRQLAEQLNASGVVFATTEPAWDAASNAAVETEFDKNMYLRVIRLGLHDLMD